MKEKTLGMSEHGSEISEAIQVVLGESIDKYIEFTNGGVQHELFDIHSIGIKTKSGYVGAVVGDWIIKSSQFELSVCKPV